MQYICVSMWAHFVRPAATMSPHCAAVTDAKAERLSGWGLQAVRASGEAVARVHDDALAIAQGNDAFRRQPRADADAIDMAASGKDQRERVGVIDDGALECSRRGIRTLTSVPPFWSSSTTISAAALGG